MKYRFLLIASLAVLSFCGTAAAANDTEETAQKPRSDANITGHVEHAGTMNHMPYVTIIIKGTTIAAATDRTGHYFLKNLPEGEMTVVASYVGYRSSEQKVRTEKGKTIEVNFLLKEEAVGIDEVVVSSNRNETNKRSSASIVNISSARLFESTASSTLSESMTFQPGLRVENNCGNCAITQLRINGLEGHYSQILLDSRPIFSSLATVYGLDQLPVSMIERVEVVRGGGSALFGANAIGGVVNIITKEPLYNSISVSNTTNVFENGKVDTNTSLGGSFVSDDHKGGFYLFGMVKNRAPYDRNGDGFSDVPKIKSETVGFRGFYKTSNYSRLTAEYHHIHEFRRGGDNFDRPPHEAIIAEELDNTIDGGGLRYDFFTADSKHRGSIFASAQNIDRDTYFGTDNNLDSYGDTKDITYVAGGQYTANFDKLLFMPSELTAGVEYTYNNLHDQYLGLGRELIQKTNVIGGFLQNEWKNDKLGILIGARLDKHNLMTNAVVSPRANVRYTPFENLGLRASYSSGFRAPQAYDEDLHVDAVGGALKLINLDPNLKPEYSHSISASADYYHSFGRVQTNFLVEGFYTRLNNVFTLVKIGEDQDGNYIMERRNAAGATVQGVNLEAKVGMVGIFEVQAGYTIQKSRYNEAFAWAENSPLAPQTKMFRSPDLYGYVTSTFNITSDFKASVFGNHTGPMLVQHTYVAADGTETDLEKTTPHFFDVGFKLAYNFRIGASAAIELSAGVKNILDSYQRDLDFGASKDAGYVYGPALPRMYFVGLKLSL